jgi:D-lactate dehydrogenase (cytochrome)
MASKGGSGLSTVKYGTTKENVVSLTVVTPAGEAVRTRQRVRKSSTGCELTQLYLGSEGTLGVITELTLKLHPILATRCGAFVAFPAIEDAARATVGLLREQLATLVRCECLNADGVAATNKKFGTALDAVPTLFLEFQSNERASGLRDAGVAEAVARKCGCTAWSLAEDGAALETLWAARRGCYLVSCPTSTFPTRESAIACTHTLTTLSRATQASMAFREPPPDADPDERDKVYISDTCVPLSRLAEAISQTEADFLAHGLCPIMC